MVKSDKAGHVAASFVAPEDFGFLHDVVIQQGARLLTQTAFNLDITARIVGARPRAGRLADRDRSAGDRLARTRRKLGVLYDNMFTGFIRW